MELLVIAGHGAGDPGASGNGYTEAERVRVLAQKIKDYGGDSVILGDVNRNYYADNGISKLTYPKDTEILELHMDSAIASAKGAHVIIKSGLSPDSYDKALAAYMSDLMPGRSEKIVKRGLKNANAAYNKGYSYRLLECGFITNPGDVKIFNENIDNMAKNILSCFGIFATTEGKWQWDGTGWWYKYKHGGYPKNQWLELDDEWYYFDEHGYAVKGWRWIYNRCYYFDIHCRMVKSAYIRSTGNLNYYHWVESDGAWQKKYDSWDIYKNKVIK